MKGQLKLRILRKVYSKITAMSQPHSKTYFFDRLQYKDGSEWKDIPVVVEEGGSYAVEREIKLACKISK